MENKKTALLEKSGSEMPNIIPVKMNGLHMRAVIGPEDKIIYDTLPPQKNKFARIVKVMRTNPGPKQNIRIVWSTGKQTIEITGKVYVAAPRLAV